MRVVVVGHLLLAALRALVVLAVAAQEVHLRFLQLLEQLILVVAAALLAVRDHQVSLEQMAVLVWLSCLFQRPIIQGLFLEPL
jgi:hypothetical protein